MESHSTSSAVDERTLLLRDNQVSDEASVAPGNNATSADRSLQLRTQVGGILFAIAIYLYSYMIIAPETDIREDIICKAYYAKLDHGGDPAMTTGTIVRDCMAPAIQVELSFVNQVYLTLDQLPGFLGLLYGIASDRIGRKKVLLMSFIGIVFCEGFRHFVNWQSGGIPLRVIWIAPLFKVFGGGDAVSATMLLSAVTDVYSEEERIILFGRVAAVAIACQIFGPLLGSVLMLKSPWIPILLGLGLFLSGAIATMVIMPETLPKMRTSDQVPETRTASKTGSWSLGALRKAIGSMLTTFWQSVTRLVGIKNISPLMFGFFASTVGLIAGLFELQYLHMRFGWTYPYATTILTIRPSVTLVVLLVIIPLATKILLSRFGVATARKDLLLLRVSAALMTAGTLLLCVANGSALVVISLVVFALGNGFVTVGKSLLLTLGPAEMAGTLLSAMNLSASVGAVVAGPLIAVAFSWGLEQGGFWLSAPILLVAILYAMTLAAVYAIQVPGNTQHHEREEGEQHV